MSSIQTILKDIQLLMRLTGEGHVEWKPIENTSCLTADFKGKGVIICRYTSDEDGQVAVSFNYLEKNGALEGEVNVMREGDPGFQEAHRLYDLAFSTVAVPA